LVRPAPQHACGRAHSGAGVGSQRRRGPPDISRRAVGGITRQESPEGVYAVTLALSLVALFFIVRAAWGFPTGQPGLGPLSPSDKGGLPAICPTAADHVHLEPSPRRSCIATFLSLSGLPADYAKRARASISERPEEWSPQCPGHPEWAAL
jgi:hypothetical protein